MEAIRRAIDEHPSRLSSFSYGFPIVVDDRSFSPAANSDFSETMLMELMDSGIAERVHVQGELRKVVRLRQLDESTLGTLRRAEGGRSSRDGASRPPLRSIWIFPEQ